MKKKAGLITVYTIITLVLILFSTERTFSSSYLLLCFQSATAFFSVCKHRQCRLNKDGSVPGSSASQRLNAIKFSLSFIRMNTMCQQLNTKATVLGHICYREAINSYHQPGSVTLNFPNFLCLTFSAFYEQRVGVLCCWVFFPF